MLGQQKAIAPLTETITFLCVYYHTAAETISQLYIESVMFVFTHKQLQSWLWSGSEGKRKEFSHFSHT